MNAKIRILEPVGTLFGRQFAAAVAAEKIPRCDRPCQALKIAIASLGNREVRVPNAFWEALVDLEKQILIIEDDDSIREALHELFSSEGYSVALAENGRKGLASLVAVKPRLVLLDLMMPVMDGRGFLSALEVLPDRELAKTPIVLITAAGEKGAADCKVTEVLTKPIDIEKLLDVAQKYCC